MLPYSLAFIGTLNAGCNIFPLLPNRLQDAMFLALMHTLCRQPAALLLECKGLSINASPFLERSSRASQQTHGPRTYKDRLRDPFNSSDAYLLLIVKILITQPRSQLYDRNIFQRTFKMTEHQQQASMLKVSVLHYRDRSHDEETWTKWYIEEQIPRFIPIAHKHGIDRCELVCVSLFSPAIIHTHYIVS